MDLSGWSLDDGTQDGEPYRMPQGTVVQPGALMVLCRRETGIALDTPVMPAGVLFASPALPYSRIQHTMRPSSDRAGRVRSPVPRIQRLHRVTQRKHRDTQRVKR